MIEKKPFGGTGHLSSRTIFGAVSLGSVSQAEADRALEMLLEYGVNHIDVAPKYGEAELRVGPWMKNHRDHFFLATKTAERTYTGAREEFFRSLERLKTDRVDLLQFHHVMTDVVEREIIMGPGGALEFFIEAKEKGLTRFIGITGHGLDAPVHHLKSLQKYPFDTVLLPCNYLLLKDPNYIPAFEKLLAHCRNENVAVQTMKATAKGYWGQKKWTHHTWYEPLTDPEAVAKNVQWVLGIPDIFLNTVGDLQVLPEVLAAAAAFTQRPTDEEMNEVVKKMNMETLFY